MSPSYCPHCGAPLAQHDARPLDLRRVPEDAGPVRRFGLGGDATTGASWQEYRRPARPASVSSDVIVPALSAAVTAAASSLVAALPVVAFDLPWLMVPAAGAFGFALSWAALLAEHRRSLWEVETYQNDAPELPAAEPSKSTTRLAVTLGNVHHERELPVEPDALLRLARALASGQRPFSERELVGAGLLSGRTQYEGTRDALLNMAWLRWRNPNDRRQGVEWTAPGRAGLRALAEGRATVDELVA